MGDAHRLATLIEQGGGPDTEYTLSDDTWKRIGYRVPRGTRLPLLVLAAELGDEDVVSTLLSHGAAVDAVAYTWGFVTVSANEENKLLQGSALVSAARNGDSAIVKRLLKAGADVQGARGDEDTIDFGIKTPLQEAQDHDHAAIARLLKSKGG